jgi:hypothetical protein
MKGLLLFLSEERVTATYLCRFVFRMGSLHFSVLFLQNLLHELYIEAQAFLL